MFKAINHITIKKLVDDVGLDNEKLSDVRTALNMLLDESQLREHSAVVILDAILCSNALEPNTDAIALAKRATALLNENEYHPQNMVVLFAVLALFKYSQLTGRTLREIYQDAMAFNCLTDMYYHYYISHTQTVKAAAKALGTKIERRQAIRDELGIEYELPIAKQKLVQTMPNDVVALGDEISGIRVRAEEIVDTFGRTIPTYVACLIVLKSLVEEISVTDALSVIPMEEVLDERKTSANNLLTAFCQNNEHNVGFNAWISRALIDGLIPVFEEEPDNVAAQRYCTEEIIKYDIRS